MANRTFDQNAMTLTRGVVKLFGKVTTSTGGTIASQDCKGFSVAKTATETGRYTVTLDDPYYDFLGAQITVVGAADDAYTADKGLIPFVRNVNVASKTFNIQFASVVEDSDANTFPDAELEDGASFYIEITLKNSSAF